MNKRPGLTLILAVGLIVGLFVANLSAQNTPSLGLDLQGGASVTLQPEGDFEDAALNVAVDIIRQRVDSLGVAEPEIIRQGNTVVVNLPGVKDQQAALDLIGRTGEVQLRQVLQVGVTEDPATTTTLVPDQSSTTLAEPSGGFGSSRYGAGTVDDTVPDFAETTEGELPVPTVDESGAGGQEVLPGAKDGFVYVVGPVAATGQVFSNDASADIINGQWVVLANLRGGAGGEDLWNLIASQCYSGSATCPTRQLAIVLDGEVISAPVVEQPSFAGGDVQISGSFSEREARDLAKILQFGAVPVKFEAPTAQTVSATLGKDSLNAAIVAGIIGVLLVMLYLVAYYGIMGWVAVGGLMLSGMLTYTIISWLSKTNGLALTLSGAAGLIVSIGVSVDSYIVYFEKLKEDVKHGRLLRNAAQRSFESTWRTILAAGLVSLIGAVTLWWLTVGSVRGFAFFLGLATTVDLIISYVFTRAAVVLFSRSKLANRRRLLGIRTAPAGGAS
jgi:preprotein translocase subunit SecD